MATTSAYDYGIRQGLVNKGVSNSDIAYNPGTGYVTVKGQNAIKAPKVYNGTSFTSQQDFNTQYDAFNKAQQKPAPTVQPTSYGQSQPSYGQAPAATQKAPQQYNPYQQTTQQNPYTQQADQIIQQLMNYGQNQQNFDPYSSNAYKAAESQANRQAQQGIRMAQESLGQSGFGRSTNLAERAQGYAGDATEYLMTQVVPQLEAQEQARRQQEYNNILSALSPLMNQQGRADDLVQRDFDNNLSVTDRTGYYKPRGADEIISQLMGLKQQAEAPTITRDARAGLSSEADILRGQLQAMGVDPALFGSNVSQSQAAQNVNRAGQMTVGKQAQDFAQRADIRDYKRDVLESDRGYDRGVLESDRAYDIDKANSTIQQRGSDLSNQLASLQLESYPEEQRLRIEQMKKELDQIGKDPYQSAADQRMDELKIEMSELELQKLREGTTEQPSVEEMRTYFDSMAQRDQYDNTLQNAESMENAILNSDLSDYDKYQMYLRYSIPWGGPVPTKSGN